MDQFFGQLGVGVGYFWQACPGNPYIHRGFHVYFIVSKMKLQMK
jgi:hypothetical protein